MLSNPRRPSYDTMRGYGSIHSNNYSGGSNHGNQTNSNIHNDNPVGRGLERRASKLDQMRADYQNKILKEKEEKMVNMYEENQRKAIGRVQKNGTGNNNGGKSVRDFFNERRRMEQTGGPVPPIDNHFRQAKGYNSPGGWSSRTSSGNSSHKTSAGRDRSQLLAPIQRPTDTQETSRNGHVLNGNTAKRSGIPQRQQTSNGFVSADENPFQGRPAFVKHKPLPPTARHDDNGNHIAPPPSQYNKQSNLAKYNQNNRKPPLAQRKPQPQQNEQSQPQPPQQPQPSRTVSQRQIPQRQPTNTQGQQKLTDFQKWQLEQNQARENRLKKLNSNKPELGEENEDEEEDGGYWGHPTARESSRSESKTKLPSSKSHETVPVTNGSLDNVELSYESEEERESEAARLERELLEKINREQAELERIKEERRNEEEQEKKDLEEQRKREAAERARRKKLEEEERKEEERRRREEAEEEKRERQRAEKEEAKRRKEDERRRKEEEKFNAKRQKEDEKRRKEELKQEEKLRKEEEKRRKEEEKRQVRQQPSFTSSRRGDYYGEEEESDEESFPLSPDTYTMSKASRSQSNQRQDLDQEDFEEQPVAAAGNSGAEYYLQMAASSEAKGKVGSLVRCKVCGRKFAADRLPKHQNACKAISKPRKEFNIKQKRVEGTDMAKYQGKVGNEPPKKKSNWRSQHNQFIENLRYAKKAAEYEKQGKDLRELGPAPAQVNPDLVPCPHCGRKFNESAAERHIPRCKDLKTKPARIKLR